MWVKAALMSVGHIRGSGVLQGTDQKKSVVRQGSQNGGCRRVEIIAALLSVHQFVFAEL